MSNDKQITPCPIKDTLDVFAGKWKPEILWHLKDERMRFNQLQRSIGQVSQRMLSQQLRELQRDGLVQRIEYDSLRPHVEYEVTDLFRTLVPIFDALEEWSTEYGAAVKGARTRYQQDNG